MGDTNRRRKICPKCGGDSISRSRLRMADHLLHGITGLRPYRCLECWERFWRQPSGATPERELMPDLNRQPSLEQLTDLIQESLRPSGEVIANDNAVDEAPGAAKKSGSNAA